MTHAELEALRRHYAQREARRWRYRVVAAVVAAALILSLEVLRACS